MPFASTLAALLLLASQAPAAPAPPGDGRFLALCYHDVVARRGGDPHAVEETAFVQQIEFLRRQGATFVSVDDLLAARRGEATLPPRAVLLTFDDGCKSFVRKVMPILRLYQIPAVLSVVTAWSDEAASADCEGGIMTWEEIAQVARSGLVEVGSHTHDFHGTVRINPQGSTAPALGSRAYDVRRGQYENEAAYRKRLARDFELSARLLEQKLGRRPRVLTWPFGAYTQIAVEEAQRAGMEVLLTIRDDIGGGVARLSDLMTVPRRMLVNHPDIEEFARAYWAGGPAATPKVELDSQRGIHADLDLLYDADPAALQRNVDRFVERVVSLKPSVVYLQAFADDSGTGNVSSVYFPNRVLPVKADLFSFVARALQIRSIAVLAWMPSLSIVLPDRAETEALRVRERHRGLTRPSPATYQRLSPFSARARERVGTLFEDLAAAAPIDGVLFQDDAFLDEQEDFHPDAAPALRALGIDPAQGPATPAQRRAWTAHKTRALIDWTDALMARVRRHRPQAVAARTLYATVLLDPRSETWLAQSYPESLKAYDQVVVMAYPRMEKVSRAAPWLRKLVAAAREHDPHLAKTVFKVQTVDWNKGDACVSPATLALWMRTLLGEGARHLAYYPDNLFADCPRASTVRELVSTEEFPLAPAAP